MTANPQQITAEARKLLPRLVEAYSKSTDSAVLINQVVQTTSHLPIYSALKEQLVLNAPSLALSDCPEAVDLAKAIGHREELIRQRQSEISEFAKLVCIHAIQIEGGANPQARAKAVESARRPLLEQIENRVPEVPSLISDELFVKKRELIVQKADEWLNDACVKLASQFVEVMHLLVERNVVGLLEVPGERVCKLNFFKHVVSQTETGRKKSRKQRTQNNGNDTRTVTTEHFEAIRGKNIHSIERHEHHVIDVTVRDPHDAGSSIPDHHHQFFLRIPEWIRRHVLLLEGHLILEQIIRTKVREESFQNQPVRTGIDEETLPIERREVVFDPALILGHFVLTGWTEREQKLALPDYGTPDSKLPFDSTVDRRTAGEQFVSLWPVAIGVTIASAVMMFFSRTQPALMIPAALLLAFVAGGLLIRCLHQKCYWKKGSIDWLFMGFGSLAVFAGLVGLQGAVYSLLFRGFPTLLPAMAFVAFAKFLWKTAHSRMED